MQFVLETGPNHPGAKMYVQPPGSGGFDMDADLNRAQRFSSKAAAGRRAKRFSTMYGLRAVPVPVIFHCNRIEK